MATVLHIEFAQDILYMIFDRMRADFKNAGDLAIGLAVMHPLQNFAFTKRDLTNPMICRFALRSAIAEHPNKRCVHMRHEQF